MENQEEADSPMTIRIKQMRQLNLYKRVEATHDLDVRQLEDSL